MAREHFWAYLKDQDGRPLVGSNIRAYLAGTADEAVVFSLPVSAHVSGAGKKVDSTLINQSTWVTGASGFFNFYVGNAWSPSGYSAGQQFRLKWWDHSVTPTAGADLDNLPIFDFIFPVDETDTDTSKNKMVSNQQAKNWTDHPDYTYAHQIHNFNPVNYESGTDQTVNKLVSDDLMWRIDRDLNTLLLCGGDAITITASGSLVDVQTIGASAWVPSGGNYVANVNHRISRTWMFPIYQIYDFDTGDIFYPLNVRDLDLESLQITSNDNTKNLKMTIVGQLQSGTITVIENAYIIEADADDAHAAWPANTNFDNASDVVLGSNGTITRSGFRFIDIAVPNARTINSAYISVVAASTLSTSCVIDIHIHASDDSLVFTDAADLNSRGVYAPTAIEWTPGNWTTGTTYTSPDIAAKIQAVIDRPGWNTGNAISLLMYENSNYRLAENMSARLVINI